MGNCPLLSHVEKRLGEEELSFCNRPLVEGDFEIQRMKRGHICTFYQKGVCAYGSRCRYDHVKASRETSSTPSSSVIEHQTLVSDAVAFGDTRTTSNGEDNVGQSIITSPSELSICSFAAAGNCPRGDKCPHIHGDLCPTCGKHCLHPFRPEEREEHMKSCENKHKHLEALKRSQEIECSVCLERVLSKPTAAERKFGLLSECDHPFCISCIRNWRSSNPTLGMDVNSTLRACPICRKLSYFVIPSVIWYSTTEEKQEIIDNYKAKLKSIDCKHFDFGDGNCPFGTSCFYKHAYRDGRLEQVVLRHLGAADGNTVIAKDIRLSDFLSNMHLR
uniref:E3 ubiquitin-protein ligase makorin n=1 Tax=Cajanus cajan TaxID=3821 RepID=A0A151QR68_CAJCA|nr:E3 ubiquitin-protein ligase makorin [Cajanus cajan]